MHNGVRWSSFLVPFIPFILDTHDVPSCTPEIEIGVVSFDTLCVNGAAIFKATTAITGMMTVQGMLTVKPSEWGSTGVFKVTDGSNVNVLQVGASGDMCSEFVLFMIMVWGGGSVFLIVIPN
eukprot:g59890.t1